jgi:hypothetical protein
MAIINGSQYDDTIQLSGSFYYRNDKKTGSKSNSTNSNDTIQTGSGNDTVWAAGGDDQIAGGNGSDILHGQDGNDTIWGDSFGNPDANDNGQDMLYGEAGNDVLHGGNGKDYLNGGDDVDQLFGENGIDVLWGGAANDLLLGGQAGDFLKGDTGADTFKYTTNNLTQVADSVYVAGAPGAVNWTAETTAWAKSWDVISDFSGAAGEGDKIDLSQIASFISHSLTWRAPYGDDTSAGMATPGLAYGVWTDTGGNFLYADITGDGKADMKIQVQGVSGDDFIGVELDTTAPTVTVDIVDTLLTDADNQSVVTFTFSEHVLGFTEADITTEHGHIVVGSLSTSDGGLTWTATFEADDGFEGLGKVEVTNASYTDFSANAGSGGSDTVTIDTLNPTVVIDIVDSLLWDGDNVSDVTVTFSEDVSGFTESDLVVTGGTLSNFVMVDGSHWTATFTATDGYDSDDDGTAGISLAGSDYTDLVGNLGENGGDTVDVDTKNPTVVIDIADASLNDGDNSSDVAITFSEEVSGFTESDLVVTGGTLSGFTTSDNITWTATFTADDGYDSDDDGTAGISLAGSDYTDVVGNAGTNGGDTVDVDTKNPTVVIDIVDSLLWDGDNVSDVTVTFSEDVSGFTESDLVVTGGTLSGFTMVDGSHWTATFTADDGYDSDDDGAAGVSLAGSDYTDSVGNAGENGGDTVDVDTKNPTVTVNIVATTLNDATPSSSVTFVFSEAVANFTAADIAFTHGTVTGLTTSDNISWTATYTADDGYDGPGEVSVTAGGYTDVVGNLGDGGSDTVDIDRFEAAPAVADIKFVPGADDQNGGTVDGTVGQFMAYDASGNLIPGVTFTSTLAHLLLAIDASGVMTATGLGGGTIEFDISVGAYTEHVYLQVGTNPGNTLPGAGADAGDMLILFGLNGGDTLNGGTNDDTLFGGGSAGQTDIIIGGLGDDYLLGGDGNDSLTGNGGADWLRGGGGNDTFFYNSADDSLPTLQDLITDFGTGDKIDLSGIDAIVGGGNDAFLGMANSASTTANSLNWYQSGGNTYLAGDVTGDATPDFVIQLTGLQTLDATSGGNVVL